jgi:hypothetical protein
MNIKTKFCKPVTTPTGELLNQRVEVNPECSSQMADRTELVTISTSVQPAREGLASGSEQGTRINRGSTGRQFVIVTST